jgi:O-antigen/teichoic acid export membrane protein
MQKIVIAAIQKYKDKLVHFTKSDGFIKYFSNTSWLMLDKVANLAIAFAIGILVARYLGPVNFGIFSFAKSIAMVFVVLCGVGLERFVIKDFVNNAHAPNVIFGTTLILQLAAASLSVLVFFIISPMIINEEIAFYLALMFLLVSLFDAFSVIRYYFSSQVQARYTAKVAMFKIAFSSLLKLGVVYYKLPLIYFGYVAVAESVLGSIGLILVLNARSQFRIRQWKFDHTYGRKLLTESWPMLISGFLTFIYMEIDQIMIKFMLGNREVGLFSIAVKLSNIWFFIGSVLCSSLFPAILNAKKTSERVYQERLNKLFKFLIVTGVIISGTVFLLSEFIINTLFGMEYILAKGSLQIHIWSVIFVFIGIAGTQWFITENLQKMLLQRTITGAVVNVLLNLILIPHLGINGAAISTLAAQFMASYASNAFSSKTLPLFKIQTQAMFFLKHRYAK